MDLISIYLSSRAVTKPAHNMYKRPSTRLSGKASNNCCGVLTRMGSLNIFSIGIQKVPH